MIWIEMSKDENHGGGEWGFTKCLWSPAYKLVGEKRNSWIYWECLLRVKTGDIVLHLRGNNNAQFTGFSTAETDGFVTTLRPPNPGVNWNYADTFYRVNLKDYTPFKKPIDLRNLFDEKESKLKYYFNTNKNKSRDIKKLLFYVIQNGSLRRQNGAYLSEVDQELYRLIIHRDDNPVVREKSVTVSTNTETGEADRSLPARKGQSEFTENVRSNFSHSCCFPGCEVKDRSFLVGAHIARWSDYPEYRGETSNGLCLCLMHDKAFELGLFTLDENLCVSINYERLKKYDKEIHKLLLSDGEAIKEAQIPINIEFIRHHWTRIGYKPRSI